MPWARKYYKSKKQKVWILVDEAGEVVLDASGRGTMKYSSKEDGRTYSAQPRLIMDLDPGEVSTSTPPAEPTASAQPDDTPSMTPEQAASLAHASPAIVSTTMPDELLALEAPEEGVIEIYTDGACSGNPGPCSYGLLIRFGVHYKEVRGFLGQGTNNIGELTGIKVALETMKRRDMPVRIHTDSSYAIGVLTKGWKAKANRELIQETRALLAQFEDVELIKVKGHSGQPLNERADWLAVTAIEERVQTT